MGYGHGIMEVTAKCFWKLVILVLEKMVPTQFQALFLDYSGAFFFYVLHE